jgi:hypothetical protein
MEMSQYIPVLQQIYSRIKDNQNGWVIAGSLSMALQGLDIDVHDIDIQTNKEGAYEIENKLNEFITTPVQFISSDIIQSYFGKLDVDGVRVEIMGAVQKKLQNEIWEDPVIVELYREWVRVESMNIPVLSLEYEYEAYKKLGRYKKAEMLGRWLNQRENNTSKE